MKDRPAESWCSRLGYWVLAALLLIGLAVAGNGCHTCPSPTERERQTMEVVLPIYLAAVPQLDVSEEERERLLEVGEAWERAIDQEEALEASEEQPSRGLLAGVLAAIAALAGAAAKIFL